MGNLEKGMKRLVDEVKADPQLLHNLLFATEETIGKLDYLDRRQKAAILALQPEDVVAGMAGTIFNPGGGVQVCGASCQASCTNTCGAGSCDGTCASSCTDTCGSVSCGSTTSIVNDRFWQVANPANFRELGGGAYFQRFQRYS